MHIICVNFIHDSQGLPIGSMLFQNNPDNYCTNVAGKSEIL